MKACPSFPGYSATEDGRIISHRRRGMRASGQSGSQSTIDPAHQYELSTFMTKKGYLTVGVVQKDGKARPVGVHQLVADAFHGPAAGRQVRHLNGNPADNRASNLAYGTALDNAQDRIDHGRYATGARHHNAKLTEDQVAAILDQRRQGVKVKDLAQQFGVSVATIEGVIYGKSYKKPVPA